MAIQKLFVDDPDEKRHRERLAQAINGLRLGKLNAVGTFTLTANSATTTVTDNLFESNMVPLWSPTTANAATAMGNVYVSSRAQGSFVLTHANNAQTDRTFLYFRVG